MGAKEKKKFVSLSNRNRRLGKDVVSWFIFIVLIISSSYCVYKLLWGLSASLKDIDEFMENVLGLPKGLPWEWNWSNYTYVFVNFNIPVITEQGIDKIWFEELFLNSFLFAGGGALIRVAVSAWMAYLTSKFNYKASKIIYLGALIVMMVPIIGTESATLKLFRTLNIYDTYFCFYFMKLGFISLMYMILYTAFRGVPNDYTEAAIMDGAGEFTIFFRVNLPMVMPLILTFLLTEFIAYWNDYMTPLIYVPSIPTLSYGVYVLTNTNLQGFSRTPMRMATSFLAGAPMVILFVLFRKQIMKKMSLGGIKE